MADLETVSDEELARELLWRVTQVEMEGDHFAKTPARFVQMLREMNTPEGFEFTTFKNTDTTEMVVIKDIPFYTLCQHHMVPFFGHVHIGYIPDKHVAGLSKFPRLVRHMAKGPWVQENLTTEIANAIESHLAPVGVAVVMSARHLCMEARGVKSMGSTTTSSMRGAFADHSRLARQEFFSLIGASR